MQKFNPFFEKPLPLDKLFMDWATIYPYPYDKETTDPYTKCRIVLMNGTEFEAQWFTHNFSRHCTDNDVRRTIATMRRIEQQQQKRISCLKPADESILEHTITYEQLAVDLTAILAKQECDCNVKNALNFGLLEDFDHLFRYSNLLNLEYNICPEKLVGGYTEITPARPTIAEHRHPVDSIFMPIDNASASILTKLNVGIITGAEQQTMNYYMNIAPFYTKSDVGRRLYQEIAMIEEEHVSQYGSLIDPSASWFEGLLMHEFTECYLYYSCMMTECDRYIRHIWEECLEQEIAHLHAAKDLLWKCEHKEWQEVIPCGDMPNILRLGPNIDYVREIIRTTSGNTQRMECVVPLHELSPSAPFFMYQNIVNNPVSNVASHNIIDRHIRECGIDYRFETAPNPVRELQDRKRDNTAFARIPSETPSEHSVCGTTANNCRCERVFSDGPANF